MGDRVDETVMLLVATYFPHEEYRVENQTGNDGEKKDDPQDKNRYLPPMQHGPPNVKGDRECDQACPEGNKENNRTFATRHLHPLNSRGKGAGDPNRNIRIDLKYFQDFD